MIKNILIYSRMKNIKINYTSSDIKNETLNCLNNKTRFSLLRMGDGEMILANNIKDKIEYFSNKQIGRCLTESELLTVQKDMIDSVLNSSVLGLPTNKHIIKNPLWEELFNYYSNIKKDTPHKWIEKNYSTIDAHFELLNSGDLFEILKNVSKIMIISPRDISEKLLNKFPNINNIEYYSVPGEQTYEVIKNTDINIFDKIVEFRNIINSKDRGGELLLFGVGPFGKILGSDFANKNGVSLDLGSVFDLLVGKITRGAGKGATSITKPIL
jgi:hypothetical protein